MYISMPFHTFRTLECPWQYMYCVVDPPKRLLTVYYHLDPLSKVQVKKTHT